MTNLNEAQNANANNCEAHGIEKSKDYCEVDANILQADEVYRLPFWLGLDPNLSTCKTRKRVLIELSVLNIPEATGSVDCSLGTMLIHS